MHARDAVVLAALAFGACDRCTPSPPAIPTGGACTYVAAHERCVRVAQTETLDGATVHITAAWRRARDAPSRDSDGGLPSVDAATAGLATWEYRTATLNAPATQRDALRAHFDALATLPCDVDVISSGTCVPFEMHDLNLPPFVAPRHGL